MNSRSTHSAGLGVCLTLLALAAAGQTTTGSSSNAAMTPSKAATANATTSAATGATTTAPASGAHKHHSTAHHQMHARAEPMAAASVAGNQETAYRVALRNCVAGPAGQREGCLDNAIARFGRS